MHETAKIGNRLCDAVLVAAGRGERLGGEIPKALVTVAGAPLFVHPLRILVAHPSMEQVLVVGPPDEAHLAEVRRAVEAHFNPAGKPILVLPGGHRRQDSVRHALERLREEETPHDRLILIHDAARPLVSAALISRCLERMERPIPFGEQRMLPGLPAAGHWGPGPPGVVPALPMQDTLKLVYEDRVVVTQPRENLYFVQTPQVFRFGILAEAHGRVSRQEMWVTDDAAVLELQGLPVFTVPGDPLNLKVTLPEDLKLVERLLVEQGTGKGAGGAT